MKTHNPNLTRAKSWDEVLCTACGQVCKTQADEVPTTNSGIVTDIISQCCLAEVMDTDGKILTDDDIRTIAERVASDY